MVKLSIHSAYVCHKAGMASLRPRAVVLVMAALTFFVLSGCATSTKYRMARADTPPAVPLNFTTEVSTLEFTLATVIVYQGPGSWKQDALWDEYVVGLTNRRPVPLAVESVMLIDPLGEKQAPGTDPWALERLSEANWEKYARVGMYVLGAGAAGQTLGLGLYAYVFGGGAAAGLLVAVPVALIVNVSVVAVKNRRNKGKVHAEFDRRRLRLPLELAPGATVEGSLFFPIVPGPQRLILQGKEGDAPLELVLDLQPLAGLHLKPATQ